MATATAVGAGPHLLNTQPGLSGLHRSKDLNRDIRMLVQNLKHPRDPTMDRARRDQCRFYRIDNGQGFSAIKQGAHSVVAEMRRGHRAEIGQKEHRAPLVRLGLAGDKVSPRGTLQAFQWHSVCHASTQEKSHGDAEPVAP